MKSKKNGPHSSSVRFFAQNQLKSKKKGLHSNLVRFLAQSLEETHRTCPLCDQILCPTCKGGHTSILRSFLCNFAILATQRGNHGTMAPLNTPLLSHFKNCFLGCPFGGSPGGWYPQGISGYLFRYYLLISRKVAP